MQTTLKELRHSDTDPLQWKIYPKVAFVAKSEWIWPKSKGGSPRPLLLLLLILIHTLQQSSGLNRGLVLCPPVVDGGWQVTLQRLWIGVDDNKLPYVDRTKGNAAFYLCSKRLTSSRATSLRSAGVVAEDNMDNSWNWFRISVRITACPAFRLILKGFTAIEINIILLSVKSSMATFQHSFSASAFQCTVI